jgi:hypothetical protein
VNKQFEDKSRKHSRKVAIFMTLDDQVRHGSNLVVFQVKLQSDEGGVFLLKAHERLKALNGRFTSLLHYAF